MVSADTLLVESSGLDTSVLTCVSAHWATERQIGQVFLDPTRDHPITNFRMRGFAAVERSTSTHLGLLFSLSVRESRATLA